MQNSWEDRVVGLAGIFQSVSLVEQLAKTGYLETDNFETSVKSLFARNPPSSEDVYGGVGRLMKGLENLEQAFKDHRAIDHRDQIRYALGVILLQKRLSKHQGMLSTIASRLDNTERKIEHFSLSHDNVIGNIADIYSDTLSTFQYRVHVTGEYHYLQQERVANQIRTLLLSAVRAATLWRQCGGNRWQLLLQRKQLVKVTQHLIQKAKKMAYAP